MKRYPARQVQVWSDVTLAALERHGRTFFSRNPQAFFLNNVRHAVENGRTPPDWFVALQQCERRATGARGRENGNNAADIKFLSRIDSSTEDAAAVYEQVVSEMLAHFQSAGQPTHLAEQNARRFAGEYVGRAQSEKPRAG